MKSKVKSENRKALPLFIVIMVLALLIGFGVGIAAAKAEGGNWAAVFKAGLSAGLSAITPYVLIAVAIFLIIYTIAVCKSAKKQISSLVEDDEDGLARADRALSIALSVVNVLLIVSYFFMAALLFYIDRYSALLFFLALGCFAVSLVMFIVSQQKFVDLAKQLYPEKRGSVYDMRFAKKWYESCDEAERLLIGQASKAAYSASQTACLAMWLLLVLSHLFFQTGLIPVAAVSVIWLVTTVTYFVKSIQLSAHKAR